MTQSLLTAREPIKIEFTAAELEELEELAPYRRLSLREKRELLQSVVGRRVLALVVEHYHRGADMRLAALKRPVTLSTNVRPHEGFGLLVIHYKLRPTDPQVHSRSFHIVSKNGGFSGQLYPKQVHSFMETV